MKTLTLTADGSVVGGEFFPKRTITMEWPSDVSWPDMLDGFRDALNGIGYVVGELGEVEEDT